jgi:hypothetical protein
VHGDPGLGSLRGHHGEQWAPPTSADEASTTGEAVLAEAVRSLQEGMGDRVVAAYALGSLAHGGFSPLVSDVDLALILTDPIRSTDGSSLLRLVEGVRSAGSTLHERLSVFWGTPSSLGGQTTGGRFPPLDRLCLLEHGRLLLGHEIRRGIARPDRITLLVGGAEFALDFLAGDTVDQVRQPEQLLTTGVRWATKVVLFPARFLFTAATGEEGTNEAAAEHFLHRANAPAGELVSAALGWRAAPPDHDRAAVLLRAELLPLYLYYIDDHIQQLTSSGHTELARAFESWRTRLTDEVSLPPR